MLYISGVLFVISIVLNEYDYRQEKAVLKQG